MHTSQNMLKSEFHVFACLSRIRPPSDVGLSAVLESAGAIILVPREHMAFSWSAYRDKIKFAYARAQNLYLQARECRHNVLIITLLSSFPWFLDRLERCRGASSVCHCSTTHMTPKRRKALSFHPLCTYFAVHESSVLHSSSTCRQKHVAVAMPRV